MSLAHPRTLALADPDLPAVSALLEPPCPSALRAAVDIAGGEVADARVAQVSWWPGRSITVRYNVAVLGGSLNGRHSFVAVAGRIPEGSMVFESAGQQVGVWRVPHDPALPGMAAAVDNLQAGSLLRALGSVEGPVETRLRAYRPRRRAVVQVRGAKHDIFLKVLRPDRVEKLHDTHRTLASSLPVPQSLGVDRAKGVVALQALPGTTLRHTLEDPELGIPPVEQLIAMPGSLPDPTGPGEAPSSIERLPSTTRLLRAITPELEGRLSGLIETIGEEVQPADTPSHGDYYEAQVMVSDGQISGLLDVDTFGWGRAADDAATMLGHLSIWADMSGQSGRVRALGSALLRGWESSLDPVDLRLRTAATVLSLASGPFRVQSAAWPSEVADRLAIAEAWASGALEQRERTLTPFSG